MTTTKNEESQPGRKRRWLRRALKVALGALLVVLVGLLGLFWRLSSGPISLGFLTERIEQRVDVLIEPLTVEMEDVVLAYRSRQQPLSLRVLGLELHDSERTGRADAPLAAFEDVGVFVSIPALLRGQLRVLGVELTGVRVTAVRSETGEFEIALAESRSASSKHPDIAELVERFAGNEEEGLQRIRLRDAALEVEDRSLDLRWGAEGLDLDLERRGASTLEAQVSADLQLDATSTAASLEATYDLSARTSSGRLELPQVIPGEVGPLLYPWSGWTALDRPISLSANLTTLNGFELNEADLSLGEEHLELEASAEFAGALDTLSAQIRIARLDPAPFAELDTRLSSLRSIDSTLRADLRLDVENARPLHVEIELEGAEPGTGPGRVEASVDLSWTNPSETEVDPSAETPAASLSALDASVSLTRLELWRLASQAKSLALLEGVTTPLSGHLDFSVDGRALERLDYDLTLGAGEIRLQDVYPEPIELSQASLRGSVSEGMSRIRLTEGRLRLGARAVDVKLDADETKTGYDLSLQGELEGFDLEQALDYWPPKVIGETRQWLVENLSGAELGRGTIEIEGALALARSAGGSAASEASSSEPSAALSLDRLKASLPFSGLDLQLLSPDLVIEGIDGSAEFNLDRIDFAVERARLRGLSISDGTVVISGLAGDAALAVDAQLNGPIATAVSVLASEPLSLIEPDLLAGVAGQFDGNLELTLPLGSSEDAEQTDVTASARLYPASWRDGPLDLDLENGDLRLELADRAIEVTGEIETFDSRVDVTYRQNFDDAAKSFEVELAARVNKAIADAFGFPEQDYFSVDIPLRARYVGQGDGQGRITVNGDLTPTAITIPEIGWSKDAGVPGTVVAEASFGDEGVVTIEDFDLRAADLTIEGSSKLSTDPFVLRAVELATLQWGDTRVHATIRRQAENDYLVVLGGEQLDLGPALAYVHDLAVSPESTESSASEARSELPALTVEVALQRLKLPKEVAVGSFLNNTRFDGRHVQELHLVGKLGADGTVQSSLRSVGSEFDFRLAATDVAILLGALRETNARGGNVELTALKANADAPWQGHLEMKDFVFLEQPTFARVLGLASLRGLADAFDDNGLEVKSYSSDFALDGKRLEVIKARAFGPTLYVTGQGDFDFAAGTMNLSGSVAPASTLQRVLGKIPIVNWLLTGRDQEGILATHFTLSGPISEPQVRVNPLSVITPGITRDIRDVFDPQMKDGEQ